MFTMLVSILKDILKSIVRTDLIHLNRFGSPSFNAFPNLRTFIIICLTIALYIETSIVSKALNKHDNKIVAKHEQKRIEKNETDDDEDSK